LNGFVAWPNGELDWRVWNRDDELKKCVNKNRAREENKHGNKESSVWSRMLLGS